MYPLILFIIRDVCVCMYVYICIGSKCCVCSETWSASLTLTEERSTECRFVSPCQFHISCVSYACKHILFFTSSNSPFKITWGTLNIIVVEWFTITDKAVVLSPCLIEHQAMEIYWYIEIYLHAFLALALDWDDWWGSTPSHFIPWEIVPDGYKAGLVLETAWEMGWRDKLFCSFQNLNNFVGCPAHMIVVLIYIQNLN